MVVPWAASSPHRRRPRAPLANQCPACQGPPAPGCDERRGARPWQPARHCCCPPIRPGSWRRCAMAAQGA
eukprot:13570835-Alexandrium_andersonii.AAC.1